MLSTLRAEAPRRSHADARLWVDTWGGDGGVREELAAREL